MNAERASSDANSSRRPIRRLVLRLLLLAILAVTGFLLGRPRGFDHGYATGIDWPEDEKYEFQTYYVGDIVNWNAVNRTWNGAAWESIDAYDEMENLIANVVAETDWSFVGGNGFIDRDEDARSLVIYQTPSAHDQIAELFGQLRGVAEANNIVLTPPASMGFDTSESGKEAPK